jgi:hypothetical protein
VKNLSIFLVAVSFSSVVHASLPAICTGGTSSDPESFVYAWVSETIKRGDNQKLDSVRMCLWSLWPKRDGAFGRVLADNLLYIADKELLKFIMSCPDSETMRTFARSIQGLSFTANSSSEKRFLSEMRRSLIDKSNRIDAVTISATQREKLEIFRKALLDTRILVID